ncbi:MAG: cell division protein FtsX [Propylenella sp.]
MTEQLSGTDEAPRAPPASRPHRRMRRKPAAKIPAADLVGQISAGAGSHTAPPSTPNPIVPPRTVARRTLLTLVAIMSFLACLSVAAVAIVADRAAGWQRQIADEVTIQIKPTDEMDIEAVVARAVDIATQIPGVTAATAIDEKESNALLEPWLGSDFDIKELPVPRLVAVRIAEDANLDALATRLREEIPTASLDDHGQWLQRLSAMARVMTLLGLVVLALVFAATALCVVFATRGAMAGNRTVIEVLHFVGAEDSYIAREFQRHFLLLGLKGASIGGGVAVGLFLLISLFGRLEGPTPEEAQLRSLFGGVAVGLNGYVGAAVTVLALAVIIAVTARLTVRRTLREID